ncbi:MAG: 50S ribosomal protein L13 [Deltaproteobacteria bacterium CG11_big_fil_rev_8_21_14_0_20_47_16]|nr:MAG: 50S ribosomal protein L13 [Deltaproteobacteria bacterium CG11_big_fil_rev_8_21_14_0_20_47_16]
MSTTSYTRKDVDAKWVVVDLAGKPLGRVATEIADILRGKNKASYTPNADTGDFVVAINASQLKLTGKKMTDKIYYRHSGYMGGLKERTAQEQMDRNPVLIVQKAVKGMLPKNALSRTIISKLKVYAGAEHPHGAQNPQQKA